MPSRSAGPFWLAATALFLAVGPVRAQERIAGENPLFTDAWTADPAPMVYRDTLYLYVGHDNAHGNEMFTMTDWLVYTTTDMKHWQAHGPIMKPTDFTWAVRDAWAAQVVPRNGKFYLYATVQHGPPVVGKAIGVAVSDRPTGPFRDARGTALVTDTTTPGPNGWDDIDPTVLIDDDGTAWLAWGNPNLYLAKLKPNMIEFDGPIQQIYLPNYTEGPWLHKRAGRYYLTYPCFAHQGMWEKICYGTAPSIRGPWTYRGILTDKTENSYTIHPGIIEYRKQWYFFYHDAKLTINGEAGALGRRAVAAEYLFYNADGSIKPIRQTRAGVSIPPHPTKAFAAPVFNPDPALAPAPVSTRLVVVQNTAPGARSWPAGARLAVTGDPRNTAITPTGFARARDTTAQAKAADATLGQTLTVDSTFRLERISLYAGDGFGTAPANAVTLAVYDLGANVDASPETYAEAVKGGSLLGPAEELRLNYIPQGPGLLHLDLPRSRQPRMEAGHSYVIELKGVRDGAAIFWRRTRRDVYPRGAAYQNRTIIRERDNRSDFAIALYGSAID